MTSNPPIGAKVRGANCVGQPFEAVVVRHYGPLHVVLSDGYVTPISLIREVVRPAEDEEPACDISGRCDPIDADADISSCRHCGKELRKRAGEWLTWDEDDRRQAADDLGSWEDELGKGE